MKERPILMSATMVRAILEGRKTQTRRIVKLREFQQTETRGYDWIFRDRRSLWNDYTHRGLVESKNNPYGKPGDRLWVKESIRKMEPPDITHEDGTPVVYSQYIADDAWTVADAWPWKRDTLPGMFMPRGLRRITLDVTGVRVERLQDISDADARAEGLGVSDAPGVWIPPDGRRMTYAQGAFRSLWEDINGRESWDANPFVWVVSFCRITETT